MSDLDALRAAHKLLRAAVPAKRKLPKSDSVLVQTYHAAMAHWDQQKADGVSLTERQAGFEKTIRACWPFTREWKYLCDRCLDYGLEIATCPGDATCGRVKAHLPHTFGSPCWCAQGSRYKEKPKPGKEDFSHAGKSKPMTRLGR